MYLITPTPYIRKIPKHYCLILIQIKFLQVRSLSGAGNFPELVEYLQKSGGDALTRNSSGNILSTVLETLDIQQHSLGVLAVRQNA